MRLPESFPPHPRHARDVFYRGWVLPWWTIILFNTLMLVHMSWVTFPAYSLAVQVICTRGTALGSLWVWERSDAFKHCSSLGQ